ncbi:hypothetical protein DICSQDRAFT_132843 [Dichomitus squalens LYAD-421 SS1]|uniref:uncharacterized protein n=1 Tax=Dichomitus squalens (strain LYAD-421) TaxID=732165 RepID=UPI00044159ED|nr:uncharacterized protein DICSQDRAFT_132843 [Dichomitus squalens LYAD-421 SS1]EJF65276.1 hypothetical protein DICSQDRAFT_132843 [Dichomitus squalens LYAD-421 SS1]
MPPWHIVVTSAHVPTGPFDVSRIAQRFGSGFTASVAGTIQSRKTRSSAVYFSLLLRAPTGATAARSRWHRTSTAFQAQCARDSSSVTSTLSSERGAQ